MDNRLASPYFVFGRRPVREQRIASYVVREHRLGRPLSEILDDPYLARCGSRSFCWSVLELPEVIGALGGNVATALAADRLALDHRTSMASPNE